MEQDLFQFLPKKATGCLIKLKGISCFEKEIEIKHFCEHLVTICLFDVDFENDEAHILFHSPEETNFFLKNFKRLFKNLIFINAEEKELKGRLMNEQEEETFWNTIRNEGNEGNEGNGEKKENKKKKIFICCKQQT